MPWYDSCCCSKNGLDGRFSGQNNNLDSIPDSINSYYIHFKFPMPIISGPTTRKVRLLAVSRSKLQISGLLLHP